MFFKYMGYAMILIALGFISYMYYVQNHLKMAINMIGSCSEAL